MLNEDEFRSEKVFLLSTTTGPNIACQLWCFITHGERNAHVLCSGRFTWQTCTSMCFLHSQWSDAPRFRRTGEGCTPLAQRPSTLVHMSPPTPTPAPDIPHPTPPPTHPHTKDKRTMIHIKAKKIRVRPTDPLSLKKLKLKWRPLIGPGVLPMNGHRARSLVTNGTHFSFVLRFGPRHFTNFRHGRATFVSHFSSHANVAWETFRNYLT